MAPEGDDGGVELELGGGLDEESLSGGSSLEEDEEDEDPELCASSGWSESDFEELSLNSEFFWARKAADSAELATDDAFAASVRCGAARERAPDAFTHLGYRSTLLARAKSRE